MGNPETISELSLLQTRITLDTDHHPVEAGGVVSERIAQIQALEAAVAKGSVTAMIILHEVNAALDKGSFQFKAGVEEVPIAQRIEAIQAQLGEKKQQLDAETNHALKRPIAAEVNALHDQLTSLRALQVEFAPQPNQE